MTENTAIGLVGGILMLVLVGSALIARRVPLAKTLRMALAWIAIFSIVYVGFLFRDDVAGVWDRARADITGNPGTDATGTALVIRRSDDGHFWTNASVNGVSARFLVDSGATLTAMSAPLAERAGVAIGGGYPVLIETANGTVQAQRGRIAELNVGAAQLRDHNIVVSDNFGDTNVLGMNFLSSFSEWRVEGSTLTLIP